MSGSRVVSLWRYPVKSMMGKELNACDITSMGVLGDRAYAVIDTSTGKLAIAKNPLKWPRMFEYRSVFIEPPSRGNTSVAVINRKRMDKYVISKKLRNTAHIC